MTSRTLATLKILTLISFFLIVVTYGQVLSVIMLLVVLSSVSGNAAPQDVILCLLCLVAAGKLISSSFKRGRPLSVKSSIAAVVVLNLTAIYYLPPFLGSYIINYVTYFIFLALSLGCLLGLMQEIKKSGPAGIHSRAFDCFVLCLHL